VKVGQKLWTREELIITIALYYRLPFGQMHARNPEVINLARALGRTPGSVAFKLVNFASLDPSLQARGIRGARNHSKLDEQIWNEFFQNIDTLSLESERLINQMAEHPLSPSILEESLVIPEGRTREQLVKIRVNQSFFRATILASYNDTCCITGLKKPELLIASHIRPWGLDEANRLNPRNGIALNALHDRAFEAGMITITPDLRIKISSRLKKDKDVKVKELFQQYEAKEIFLPKKFFPDPEFLRYHNTERFKG
jgi:putative restriction endonuclease